MKYQHIIKSATNFLAETGLDELAVDLPNGDYGTVINKGTHFISEKTGCLYKIEGAYNLVEVEPNE